MNTPESLKARMVEIAQALTPSPEALALLGLGSVGLETERLDSWSDLDFFVIVREGYKKQYLSDPSWLETAHPVAYRFANTPDGFKLLFADGIFAEMAVFEPQEMAGIPFAEGRVWWAREGFDTAILRPVNQGGKKWMPPSADFLVGELLTCLYVGLCRYRRGEQLSAWRFIQGYCLDRFLELAEFWETPGPGFEDPYNRDRRFEDRFPVAAQHLPGLLTGYRAIPESALAFLDWLESKTGVNQAMAKEIRKLAGG